MRLPGAKHMRREAETQREEQMKTHYKIGIALIAGVALGAAAVKGLNAQAKPPGYFVFDIEVTNSQGYQPVIDRTPATLVPYGGRFLIRGGPPKVLEGAAPNRFGIIAFDSVEKAQAWYDSPATKEVTAIRTQTAKSRTFLIEGASN
jgi:uncharacterized protein (DUF1330 family)